MPFILLRNPEKLKASRTPFIYTRAQIRALLTATTRSEWQQGLLDGRTLRVILIVLYATGATADEVLALRWSNIQFKSKCVVLDSTFSRRRRTLPIGDDLCKILSEYKVLDCNSTTEELVFRLRDGRQIRRSALWDRLNRLHRFAGVLGCGTNSAPRLQDLRYTFAVHRLTQWIREGRNLNDLLPALSTYMGYSTLTKAEQFLAYAPERFRQDLQKLSPATGTRWRDQPELLSYLSAL
jgi:integrase/recombinase XerD